MLFKSTNKKSKNFRFSEVLRLGLAPDGGLFMPGNFPKLPNTFFRKLSEMNFKQIAKAVISKYAREVPENQLEQLLESAFNFQIPLKKIRKNLYILELFYGPTMAFKDFGARFLSRALGYFLKKEKLYLNIIVATSGDTGSAVASGFFNSPNTRIFILYPSGQVSPLQEKQLTTFGGNITALEVKGTFDDCQRLAKQALADVELNRQMRFSSANSINFGRLLPQSLYYFWAVGQLRKLGNNQKPAIVVPSGNFGNLFAGLMAKKMGLPVKQFIAACNANNVVPVYLKTGKFYPKASLHTISNAMDVGNPSNFARMLEMYGHNHRKMGKDVLAFNISDAETRRTIKNIYVETGYICDPHTAVGIAAAARYQKKHKDESVIVFSTAHPAKFKEIVEPVIGKEILLPKQLQAAIKKRKQSIKVSKSYEDIKKVLLKFK